MHAQPGEGWSWQQRDGLSYLILEAFAQTGLVRHAFSGRSGGASKFPYDSLNLCLHVGDEPSAVLANRQRLAAVLETEAAKIVVPAQVHSDRVAVVGSQEQGLGAQDLTTAISRTDALVTEEPGVMLCTVYADCVPIFILDPVRPAIGLAHAGWKGTLLKIAEKTLQRMQQAFGTLPADCLVGIGPAIGPCCYQVDLNLRQKFAAAYPGKKIFVSAAVDGTKECQKWSNNVEYSYLDLGEANRQGLLASGVKPERIWKAGLCTRCHPADFYSYRGAEGGTTGRMGALIALTRD
jgi:YfiH family protein